MTVLAVIPARMQSTRLPNKPLLSDTGMPLVVHTARNAAAAGLIDAVVVVTDSHDVYTACRYHECDVVYHECDAWCGTQRVAEAVRGGELEGDLIVDVQCDEPLVQVEVLDDLVRLVGREPDVIGTIVAPLGSVADFADENIVKADVDYGDHVTYFCRSGWFARPFHHVGVYTFTRQKLLEVGSLPQSDNSRRWSLEQLTWMDAGHMVRAVHAETAPLSVNSPEDYERFVSAVVRPRKLAAAG